ncbi:hypothetical protein RRG08_060124 [Elysia crispata]|uniref:Uncharacterized protein n=1 Tax=Elysia crispata TaxID=231223 RepID=A0AAE1BBK5_9GAST|nr:hypothetical protein RRG08_060124 [Elysia crispata]
MCRSGTVAGKKAVSFETLKKRILGAWWQNNVEVKDSSISPIDLASPFSTQSSPPAQWPSRLSGFKTSEGPQSNASPSIALYRLEILRRTVYRGIKILASPRSGPPIANQWHMCYGIQLKKNDGLNRAVYYKL